MFKSQIQAEVFVLQNSEKETRGLHQALRNEGLNDPYCWFSTGDAI
jgi:hypothetical protein